MTNDESASEEKKRDTRKRKRKGEEKRGSPIEIKCHR